MKRIAIDMDGVLADVYAQFSRWHEAETGEKIAPVVTNGLKEFEAYPNARNYVFTDGFFRSTPLIEGCLQVVEDLNKQYEVFIVSAAMEFSQSLSEKKAWLDEHFPFLSWKQIVFCGSKQIVSADIMIDDHFKNLDFFQGRKILFSQPHNIFTHREDVERVHNWLDVRTKLL
jgi:5'-nucleotidase